MGARTAFVAAVLAAVLLLAACGSDSGKTLGSGERLSHTPTVPSSVTVTVPAGATASGSAEPAPVLGGNVTAISPVHGATVRQITTTSPDPQNPHGVCAKVDFTDLPENFQWFRMVFDGQEVTSQLVLIAKSTEAPKDGSICYAPEKGFSVGHHIAGVAVESPRDPTASPRQIVQWSFDVVP